MVQTVARQSFEPDPAASLPQADWLMVQGPGSFAPLAPGTMLTQSTATVLGGQKPLRPPKGPTPRATSVYAPEILSPGAVPAARVLTLRPPPSPTRPTAPTIT